MKVANPFGPTYEDIHLPDHTTVVSMKEPKVITNPQQAIADALRSPIGTPSLAEIAAKKMHASLKTHKRNATAVILVSDNTRPVPYKGEEGILLPIVTMLMEQGYDPANITVLIGTGTHRAMKPEEIRAMIDPKVLALPVVVVNHDCKDESMLVNLGKTSRNTEITINKRYIEADLKIATGLVESHFMAGASGGRKAVCPGIIGEKGTYVFHGAELMADPESRDLNIENNPVHQEALEVAKAATVDFIVNVTLNHSFHLTGIFAGDLEQGHMKAVEHIRTHVQVQSEAADIVITHAGFVGINHYQCAKCAVASMGILKKDGFLIIIADTTDVVDPVGSLNYRTSLSLLTVIGQEAFNRLIRSGDWTFIPEQWQVQQWGKVFERIPMDHLYFYAPQFTDQDWNIVPGIHAHKFAATENPRVPYADVITGALSDISRKTGKPLDAMRISWIDDGPYVVPVQR